MSPGRPPAAPPVRYPPQAIGRLVCALARTGAHWWRIAAVLNRRRVWAPLQSAPWSPYGLKSWLRRELPATHAVLVLERQERHQAAVERRRRAKAVAAGIARPRTRGECLGGPRPCPWAGCQYHLALEVDGRTIRMHHGEDPLALPDTCALDVADRGEHNQPEIGRLMGLSKVRIHELEHLALAKIRAQAEAEAEEEEGEDDAE